MKTRWLVFLLFIGAATASISLTYPKVGELALNVGAGIEARIYGLEERTLRVDDVDMSYYDNALEDKPAIVMIHGYTAHKDVWPRFAKHFSKTHRIVIPDLAGHGKTNFEPGLEYTQAAQARRVLALMDTLGITKAHITGNSMGGYIAAYIALYHPNRTLSVALFDPAGVISPVPSELDQMIQSQENAFLIHSREDFSAFYPMTMAKPPWLPGFVLDAMADDYLTRRESYALIFNQIHQEKRLTDDLSKMQPPSLLIWGDQDRLLHVSATDVWTQAVPSMQLEVLPGVGHMPMVEVPKESADIYQQFLANL